MNDKEYFGKIDRIDTNRGFAILYTPSGEYFLHITNFKGDGFHLLRKDDYVLFEKSIDRVRNRRQAIKAELIVSYDDWKKIFDGFPERLMKSWLPKFDLSFPAFYCYEFQCDNDTIESFVKSKLNAGQIRDFIETFTSFLKIVNNIDFAIDGKEDHPSLMDVDFWNEKVGRKLITVFNKLVNEYVPKETERNIFVDFYLYGVSTPISWDLVSKNIRFINVSELGLLLNISHPEENKLCDLFDRLLEHLYPYGERSIKELFLLAKEHLSKKCFDDWKDKKVNELNNDTLLKFYLDKTIELNWDKIFQILGIVPYRDLDVLLSISMPDSKVIHDLIEKLISLQRDSRAYTEAFTIAKKCFPEAEYNIWKEQKINQLDGKNLVSLYLNRTLEIDWCKVLQFIDSINYTSLDDLLKIASPDKLVILDLADKLIQTKNDYYASKKAFEICHEFLSDADYAKWKDEKLTQLDGGIIVKLYLYKIIALDWNRIIQLINVPTFKEFINLLDLSVPENEVLYVLLDKWISRPYLEAFVEAFEIAEKHLPQVDFATWKDKKVKQMNESEWYSLWNSQKISDPPVDFIFGGLLGKETISISFDSVRSRMDLKVLLEKAKEYIQNVVEIQTLKGFRELQKAILLYVECKQTIENVLQSRTCFSGSVDKQVDKEKELIKVDVDELIKMENPLVNLILWSMEQTEEFDFETFKSKFVYFSPKEQALMIKHLFYYKAIGKMDLTIEMLQSIIRFDANLYKELDIDEQKNIDLSTDVIIQSLAKFSMENKFIIEQELFEIVYMRLGAYKNAHFQIGCYFDKCLGRKITRVTGRVINGFIPIEHRADGNDYYLISVQGFLNNENVFGNGQNDNRPYITRETFENRLREIRNINNSRYDPSKSAWCVPLAERNSVYNFAVRNLYKMENEEDSYLWSYHYEEAKAPYNYCHGREANCEDQLTRTKFLWCKGQKCFWPYISLHEKDKWKEYTMLDFCSILGFDLDWKGSSGGFIKYGKYLFLVDMVDRATSLLEHLYCKECGEILYPKKAGNFLVLTVPYYACKNDKCGAFDKPIYLSHCSTTKCHGIIDERETKQCPNGWYICPSCGNCCSTNIFAKRIADRQTLQLGKSPTLEHLYVNKMGHLEKSEYYCWKCARPIMSNDGGRTYVCEACDVKYDISYLNIDRTYKSVEYFLSQNERNL